MHLNQVIVIGAGPAGLTAAYELLKQGVKPIVLEKSHTVGGLARTENYKGYRVDMGGHRFFTKVEEVQALWQEILGEDFLRRPRLSRIYYNGKYFYYPLRFFNALSGLGMIESALILLSYIRSQLFPHPREETFEEWVSNRFGPRLYRIFFKTYTEKVWGIPCSEIKAEWAAQRIRGLSLPAAVLNAILKPKSGSIKTLIDEFHYPRHGPGMLWQRAKEMVEARGGEVRLHSEVIRVEHDRTQVTGVSTRRNGREEHLSGNALISSMPISELIQRLDPPAPAEVRQGAAQLSYRDFLTVALIVKRPDVFPDNWIYIHSPEVQVGRVQNFKNWSPEMVPDPSRTCLGLEYFCNAGDALWNLSDAELIELGVRELERIGLVQAAEVEEGVVFRQTKAYPVYTGEYQAHLDRIRQYLARFPNLQTVGRNGLHMYNNQDHSMLTAILAVRNLMGEQHDVWSVNTERSYHEEIRVPAPGTTLA